MRSSLPPCRGIFHLAGAVDDGRIEHLDWARFSKTLTAKVDGSMYLHEHSIKLELPIDHFVLFSSIYGLLGNKELSHYGAANAFQDGLAHARRRAGLPGLAVSWGTWGGAGMAHRFGKGFESYWKGQGMGFVGLNEGMATLIALLTTNQAHAAVLPTCDDGTWVKYAKTHARNLQPLTVGLLPESFEVPTTASPTQKPNKHRNSSRIYAEGAVAPAVTIAARTTHTQTQLPMPTITISANAPALVREVLKARGISGSDR